MPVIALLSSKGGSGKTTLSLNLAVAAADDGCRVALYDADSQGSTAFWHSLRLQREAEGEVQHHEINPDLCSGGSSIREAVRAQLTTGGRDWVIVDGGPASMKTTAQALQVCDLAIVPVMPSGLDVHGAEEAFEKIAEARVACLVVVNRASGGERSRLAKQTVATFKEFGFRVAGTIVAAREAYPYAFETGRAANEVDDKAKAEIAKLWQEVKALALTAAAQKAGARRG